ncbi:SLC13 family permease [Vagococcus humatus]|uniref:Citrate transporter-like domain-containing protein n=1 Tax=Vagococcus humatus TaxID=1889241 RepID=A0A3S0A5C2_9ENTE|nr:SLC13 family permease [Vagococcus humatus]RST89371.1 hypothetical protein C7P63_06250 [Vagococcus humatus]
MNKLSTFLKQDLLFTIALFLAVISCTFGQLTLTYIDFNVIFSLFGLMAVIKGLEEAQVLTFLAQKLLAISKNTRVLMGSLWTLSLFGSMILTNDVAILTLIPIYFKIINKIPHFNKTFIGATFIIVFANLGSSFLPFGNPHNLFLFSYFQTPLPDFFSWTSKLLLLAILILLASLLFIPKQDLNMTNLSQFKLNPKQVSRLSGLMILMILAILGAVPLRLAVILVTISFFVLNPTILRSIDYHLLGTFICFFLIVGNISNWVFLTEFIEKSFQTNTHAFLGSILLSQFISNVPASILIAPFTDHVQAIMIGLNLGGLGTLIASLANLIGYKLIKVYVPNDSKQFLIVFTKINVLLLVTLTFIFILVC